MARIASSKAARALNLRRRTYGGGRPKKLRPCPHCGARFGAVEFRAHLPRCPAR